MRLRKGFLIVVLVVLVGWIATKGYDWYEHGRFIEETDNAYIKSDSISIRAEISGRIETLAVQENQHVRQGQLLVRINASDYQAKLAQANAELSVAEAALVNAQQQISLQDKKIDEAKANIDAAKAEVKRGELNLARFQVLDKQSFDSKQQLQNTEADVAVAKAKQAQAEAAYAATQQMFAVLDAQKQSAAANISSAESQIAYAQSQLAKTDILAPSDGIVGNLGARTGGLVQPTMTLLYLVPLPQVYVVANYKETQIGHMTIGQPVKLTVDAQDDVEFTGVVASISPATGSEFSLLPKDNATGNFNKIVQRVPVRIQVTGPSEYLHLLRPGLSVVPHVDTQGFNQQSAYLPNEEVLTSQRDRH
ncbi:multidrug resistance protein A [Paraglaciecola mesophila KMM 241]|uniref:Multidrug resistance protein A n=1 Tax=Paraglaciecola mesophila KMM 241 TaxID=1128912 RepID=K6XPJ8_9ALTE|nr:HlyD family secretion protein [Paraglaciecola mesophila]GAC22574.1 multidrug resistance protein A [Paraglaciecola mesophila KMM 241]|tara:strand:+ start:19563 stop:20654 length:1092 start_codon:yes stop_codon:yes gene_type:complete